MESYPFLNKIIQFFRLLRWPNLLVVALTQLLIKFFVIDYFYSATGAQSPLPVLVFVVLSLATTLIAAGGYVINDYFDTETDRINKPDKLFVGNAFSRQQVVFIYLMLNIAALLAGTCVSFVVSSFRLTLVFPAVIMMLWLYSVKYKREVLSGNLLVAALSALVILMVWMAEFFMLKSNPAIFVKAQPVLRSIFIFTLAYSGFAFLVSLVREITKDLEDAEGDLADGCKTFVIAYGVGASKRLIIVLLLLLLLLIAVAIYFLISYSFLITGIWLGIFTFLPVAYLFFKVKSASAKPDYSRISMLLKVLMICGVLSMLTLSY